MGLILPLLFLGLMASLSPATIVVFVLVLGTARARMNAVGFLFGWGISLTIVFAGSYALAASGAAESDSGRTSVAVLEMLLGVVLLVVAVRVARRPPKPPTPAPSNEASRWGTARLVGRMEALTPVGAAVVGILKQPWAITTAAALVVAHNHTTGLLAAIAFVLFTVFSTATVGLMFVYYSRYPGEAQARLADLRDRAVSAGPAMGSAVAAMVGVFLLLDGLFGLL